MAGTESVTTQSGVTQGEDVETAVVVTNPGVSERELAIESIAARKAAEHGEVVVEKAADVVTDKATGAAAAVADLSTDAQLGQQLEDGSVVLDEATLARAFVRTKVDGKEELVPATKALGQYQKNGAADVRLAEATRMSKEAAEQLRVANERVATAATPAAKEAAAADVAAAEAKKQTIMQDFSTALFEGDIEKANKLFSDAVQAAMPAQSTAPAVTVKEIVDQAVPAVKQRLSVDGALDKLFSDYPEIAKDSDLTLLADARVNGYVAQGKSQAEAIHLAGEDIGVKYSLGQHAKKDTGDGNTPTTRAQKLAAKEGLDEPQATAARAASGAAPVQTNSDVIAEMARARGQLP